MNRAPQNFQSLYFRLNAGAVLLHLLNAVGVGIAHEAHLKRILPGYLFVSPTVQLQWTNHALVRVEAADMRCREVAPFRPSPGAMQPFPDFMRLFNFSGTDLVQYQRAGGQLSLNMMILSFFLLSVGFQSAHGVALYFCEDLPRFLHYLEYAFSSPLMVMVMAVEVGIVELFLVMGLGGLFFGMNIAGMCAEVLTHYAGYMPHHFAALCWLVHCAGWVLFFLAMIPIWAQFHQVLACSENGGTPDYVYAVIVVESLLFFLFGLLQILAMREKLAFVWRFRREGFGWALPLPVQMLFKYDCMHAVLSLVAKTLLAWLLLGPALSVDLGVLAPRHT